MKSYSACARPGRWVLTTLHTSHTSIHMNTTIRDLEEPLYREIKARAARTRRTVGEIVNEAFRAYLTHAEPASRTTSLTDLKPVRFPPGNRRLSENVDTVVYDLRK